MAYHTCPQCGRWKKREEALCPYCVLHLCPVCGSNKTFHLCPECDADAIAMRQRRLERSLHQAKENQKMKYGRIEAPVQNRDNQAASRLQKLGSERMALMRSLISGCVIAIPLIAVGLQMSVKNTLPPLGLVILLLGMLFLVTAVHFHVVYDTIRDAKRWQRLSYSQKCAHLARAQNRDRPRPIPPEPRSLRKAF